MGNLCVFKLFSVAHIIYFLLSVGIVLGLFFALKKLGERARFIANICMFSSLIFFILLEFIGRIIIIDKYNFFDNLPINFYQIFAVIMTIGFFRKNTKWLKFGYLVVMPIAAFSLIFIPKFYTEYSAFSVSLISYVFSHALLVAIPLVNVFEEEVEVGNRDILDANMNFAIIAGVLHILNVVLRFSFLGVHANYGGTMGEGYDLCLELLSTLIPVPFVFMLPIFAIVVGITFLLAMPLGILKHRRQKQSEIEELIALGNLKAQQEYRQKYKQSSSQIYLKSEEKARPTNDKGVTNKTKTDFVAQNKEIQVNKETTEK